MIIKSFKLFLQESPIGDYKTFGDWKKASSFRNVRDRMLIQHPKSIERMKKKFANIDVNFNLFFINNAMANKLIELGEVNEKSVRQYFGDEIADEVINSNDFENSINVIFTNNKGDERKPFTAWIAAHRIGHALARKNNRRENYAYLEASNLLINNISEILSDYGYNNFPRTEKELTVNDSRRNQLIMMNLFSHLATFKSARDKNIRNWFEVLNELIAQYITTGKIKFNNAPDKFGNSKIGYFYLKGDKKDLNNHIQMLARDMEFMINDIFSSLMGSILIM